MIEAASRKASSAGCDIRLQLESDSGTNGYCKSAVMPAIDGRDKQAIPSTCRPARARRFLPAGEIMPRSFKKAITSRFSGSKMEMTSARARLLRAGRLGTVQASVACARASTSKAKKIRLRRKTALNTKPATKTAAGKKATAEFSRSLRTPSRMSPKHTASNRPPGRQSRYRIMKILNKRDKDALQCKTQSYNPFVCNRFFFNLSRSSLHYTKRDKRWSRYLWCHA